MAVTATGYEHIVLDAPGEPRIAGTQLRVIDLVAAKHANGWTAEQLHEQHPELTGGQIYSALAYYCDHREELDAAIIADQQELEQLKGQTRPSRLVERLRRDGKI